MKVFHLYKCYYPETVGGIETVIDGLCHYTAEMGVENHLVTTCKQAKPYTKQVGSVTVHYFPQTIDVASCPMSLSLVPQFKQLLNQADVIHCHFPWPFAELLICLLPTKAKKVVTYHSDIVKQKWLKYLYAPIMHRFFKTVDRIIVTSENYSKTSVTLQRYQDKTKVIPLFLNESLYQPAKSEAVNDWRERLGADFFLFIGVLRYYKGLDFLLKAMAKVSAKLVIAGAGPQEAELKALVTELKLTNVIFVGRVSDADKQCLLQLCRSVVMPSHLRSEAFGMSLLEGLYYQKPLISTEIGTGTSFVNQDQVTGVVVPPKDPTALANALNTMLEAKAYQGFVANIKPYYQQHFSPEVCAQQYVAVYEGL